MKIRIKCIPPKATAQGSSRVLFNKNTGMYRIGRKSDSNASMAKHNLCLHLKPYVPKNKYDSPLAVCVEWIYPFRKNEKKIYINQGYRWCDKRPDCDNLMKLLFDAMTYMGFWHDDSLISKVEFSKLWGEEPGINIDITEIRSGL